jgi:hypothetical protein
MLNHGAQFYNHGRAGPYLNFVGLPLNMTWPPLTSPIAQSWHIEKIPPTKVQPQVLYRFTGNASSLL